MGSFAIPIYPTHPSASKIDSILADSYRKQQSISHAFWELEPVGWLSFNILGSSQKHVPKYTCLLLPEAGLARPQGIGESNHETKPR